MIRYKSWIQKQFKSKLYNVFKCYKIDYFPRPSMGLPSPDEPKVCKKQVRLLRAVSHTNILRFHGLRKSPPIQEMHWKNIYQKNLICLPFSLHLLWYLGIYLFFVIIGMCKYINKYMYIYIYTYIYVSHIIYMYHIYRFIRATILTQITSTMCIYSCIYTYVHIYIYTYMCIHIPICISSMFYMWASAHLRSSGVRM